MSKSKSVTKSKVKQFATRLLKLFGPSGTHWAVASEAYNKNRGGRSDPADASNVVQPYDPSAKSWCLLGAISKLNIPSNDWLEEPIRDNGLGSDIADFNDEDGWPPVRKLLAQLAKHGEVTNANAILRARR